MKTKQWLFAALTVLLLVGCSTETDLTRTDDVNPSIPEGMTQLSFEIKGVRTGTSYVALTPDEAQLQNLIVVLFPQSESGPQPDATSVAALKAKVTTKDGAYRAAVLMDKTIPAGKYYATLLANIGAMMGVGAITEEQLDGVVAMMKGQTYTTLFVNSNASEFIAATDRGGEIPVADYGLGMKALVKDISVSEADRGDVIPLKATLTRPQARFDIKNTAYKSFTITGYQRKNVQSGTRLYFLDSDVEDNMGKVDRDPVTLTDAQKTLLNTPTFDDDNDPVTPLVMTYNPAFYCYPGEAADQSYVEITGELKVSTGGTRTVTYTIPLKTQTPDAYIAIQSNKRYKIELKMTESEQLTGDVTLDAGSWDDEGGNTGDDNIEEQLPGEIASVTGATYDAATKTFNVAENTNTFSFAFVVSTNTLQKAATTSGIVEKVEVTTTRVAPSTKYTVTLAATGSTGAIEEMGEDKDGTPVVVNTYKVQRGAAAPTPPADVNGHKPVLIDNLWFVDPSAAGKDNENASYATQAAAKCPSGWRVPTIDEVNAILTDQPVVYDRDKFTYSEIAIVRNTDFFTKVGATTFHVDDSAYGAINDDGNAIVVTIGNGVATIGQSMHIPVRCVQKAN